MPEPTRGLLDTSVLIDYDQIDSRRLPDESAIAAITLAELAAGPHATEVLRARCGCTDRLRFVERCPPAHVGGRRRGGTRGRVADGPGVIGHDVASSIVRTAA